MTAIIDGVRYDTEKATLVGQDWNGCPRGDLDYLEVQLYLTARGSWFLAARGGARTEYAQVRGRTHYGGSEITPLPAEAARRWLERHDHVDALEEHFSDSIVDA